jgi:hypothetical protein
VIYNSGFTVIMNHYQHTHETHHLMMMATPVISAHKRCLGRGMQADMRGVRAGELEAGGGHQGQQGDCPTSVQEAGQCKSCHMCS